MKFKISILIYIYLALCVCMLAFNIIYASHRKWNDFRMPHKIAIWQKWLQELLDSNEPLDEKTKRKIERKLSKISQLTVFYEVVKTFWNTEGKSSQMTQWIKDNGSIFAELGTCYMKKPAIEQSYYAFLMKEFQLGEAECRDSIVPFMLELVLQPSIYCRENALQALYSFGEIKFVAKAYLILNRNNIEHSSKLVTDGLLSFNGDKGELIEDIWSNWERFSPFYQTAFVNFFRMTTYDISERLLPLLEINTNREVKFAVIRYYRNHYYKDAQKYLLKYTSDYNNEEWEFAALAANSLGNFPGDETVAVLVSALNSGNWFVRNNASDAIIAIAPNHPSVQTVLQEEDLYAKEMMRYKLSKYNQKINAYNRNNSTEQKKKQAKAGDKVDGCN